MGALWITGNLNALLRKALPRVEVIATDGFSGSAIADDTLHRFDGVRYVRLVDVDRPNPALSRLNARYQREGWREPSDQAILSYDAVLLLAEAIRAAGPKREAIRDWLTQGRERSPSSTGAERPDRIFPERRSPAAILPCDGRHVARDVRESVAMMSSLNKLWSRD